MTVTIPAFPALGTTVAGINDTVDEFCPGCSTGELELTVDDLAGGQVVPKLVAYLQSNPETNYVLFNFADLEIGVPEALEAAGLDKVKLIGNGGGPQQFEALVAGDSMDAAWVAYPASTRVGRWSTPLSGSSTAAPCPTDTNRRWMPCRRTSSTPQRQQKRSLRRTTWRSRGLPGAVQGPVARQLTEPKAPGHHVVRRLLTGLSVTSVDQAPGR